MGGNQSLLETQVNLRIQSKEAQKMYYKCMKEEEDERLMVKSAIELRNRESARTHAANSIRKQNEAIRFLEFKTRLDVLIGQIDYALRNHNVTSELKKCMPKLNRMLKSKKIESVEVIKDFRKIFEDLEVRDSYASKEIENDFTYMAPSRDVDYLITKVAEDFSLDVGDLFKDPPNMNGTINLARAEKSLS